MKKRTPTSLRLRDELLKRGYHESLCEAVSYEMNTDLTAGRMLDYLAYFKNASEQDLVDEMLAILSDRDRWQQKIIHEQTNAAYNEYLWEKGRGL